MKKVSGLLLNLVLLSVGVGSGLVFTSSEAHLFPIGHIHVLASLVSMPAAVVFLIWLLARRSSAERKWPRPSFWSSPFDFEVAPLTLFLVVGTAFVVSGSVGVIGRLLLKRPFDLSPAYFVTTGAGALIGLRIAMHVFRSRVEQSNYRMNPPAGGGLAAD